MNCCKSCTIFSAPEWFTSPAEFSSTWSGRTWAVLIKDRLKMLLNPSLPLKHRWCFFYQFRTDNEISYQYSWYSSSCIIAVNFTTSIIVVYQSWEITNQIRVWGKMVEYAWKRNKIKYDYKRTGFVPKKSEWEVDTKMR